MPFSLSGLFELPQQYATYERNMHRHRERGREREGETDRDRQTDRQTALIDTAAKISRVSDTDGEVSEVSRGPVRVMNIYIIYIVFVP